MKIALEDLNGLIADFVQIGFMTAVKNYEPPQDMIKTTEIKKWLKFNLIEYKYFKALVSRGLVKRKRNGTKRNSPLYYSKKEIKQALAVAKIDNLIIQDEIKSKKL